MEPQVGIIILRYFNDNDLGECLESLKNITYKNYKLYIINNEKINRGFARGNNEGIKMAIKDGCDYVLLLNNDVIIPELSRGFLKGLVNQTSGIGGCYILDKYAKNWFTGGYISKWTGYARHSATRTDYVSGCCMMIHKDVIAKIGLLDEDFFFSWEDVEYCVRAKKAGFKIDMSLGMFDYIIHKVAQSSGRQTPFSLYHHTKGELLFHKKHKIGRFFWLAFGYNFFRRFFGSLVLRKWDCAKAVLKGVRDAHSNRRKDSKL